MGKIDSASLENHKLRLFKGPLYETGHGPLQTYCADAAGRLDIVKKSTDRAALEDALRAADSREGLDLKFRLSEGSAGEHDPYAGVASGALGITQGFDENTY